MSKKESTIFFMALVSGFLCGVLTMALAVLSSKVNAQSSLIKVPQNVSSGEQQSAGVQIYDQVQAKSFKLFNGSKKLIATLKSSNFGLPEMLFFEPESGKARIRIALAEAVPICPELEMFDHQGRKRVAITLSNHGEGILTFLDDQGNWRFRVACDPGIEGKLYFSLNKDIWYSLSCNPNTSQLILQTKGGRRIITTPASGTKID